MEGHVVLQYCYGNNAIILKLSIYSITLDKCVWQTWLV